MHARLAEFALLLSPQRNEWIILPSLSVLVIFLSNLLSCTLRVWLPFFKFRLCDYYLDLLVEVVLLIGKFHNLTQPNSSSVAKFGRWLDYTSLGKDSSKPRY